MRTHKRINPRTREWDDYHVYTKEEADELGIEYQVGWQAAEEDTWLLTDDNYVVYVIAIITPTESPRMKSGRLRRGCIIYTSGGQQFTNPTMIAKKMEMGSRRNVVGRDEWLLWERRNDGRIKMPMMAKIYARLLDREATITFAHPDATEHQRVSYRKYWKSEKFKSMLAKEVEELLDDSGFSKKETMDLLREILELARAEGNLRVMHSIAGDLLDIHGFKAKVKVSETHQLTGVRQSVIDGVVKEEQRIDAAETRAIEGRKEDVLPD